MATDPHLLTMPPCPVTGFPDIIHAAIPISGATIVRSIANRDYDGAFAVIWPRTVVRSVVARVSAVITFTSAYTKHRGNQSEPENKRFHLHILIFGSDRVLRACI
jgi:hypothetical protein